MKKNAIVIASILFAAAGASSQAADQESSYNYNSDLSSHQSTGSIDRSYETDPSIASQHDPASSGNFGTSETGSASSQNERTSVRDYHADSSIRGGSNEARGVARQHLGTEGPAHPMNPAYQADSSIRGGSMQARNREMTGQTEPPRTYSDSGSRFKADSSIRGGSNEARSGNSSTFRGSSSSLNSASSTVSPNWNPSDDLLKDGTHSGQAGSSLDTRRDGLGAPANSVSGMESSRGHLNASSNLEKNISGEYNINKESTSRGVVDSSQVPSDASFSSEAVGGPGSTQTGSSSSSEAVQDSTSSQTTVDQHNGAFLFHNNRAQGVGSAAAGQMGASRSGSDLAEHVKSVLTDEATGTFGMTSRGIARNVKVSAHGSTIVLKGTVPNERDKEMVAIRAREVAGVQRVDNQLKVSSQPENPDASVRSATVGHDLEDRTDNLQDIQPK